MGQNITLVHPDGKREFVTDRPTEINNLVYAHGYTVKGSMKPETAIAKAAGVAPADDGGGKPAK